MPSQQRRLTGKEWAVLAVIGSVHLTGALCVSLQAPFYPLEASLKGVSPSQFGFVFGVYDLVACISSPIFGNYVGRIGVKFALNAGVFVAAVSSILFGLLQYVPGPTPFVVLSFSIRIVEALGATAAVTSAFAISAALFPDNLATTFATLEIFYGVGFILGPLIGGLLHSVGGFMAPFIALGALMLVVSVIIHFILPPYNSQGTIQTGNFLRLVKIPGCMIDFLCIAGATMCDGFYNATLEPHIRHLGLTSIQIGLVFATSGLLYATMAPLVGRLCDRYVSPRHILISGSIFVLISVFLIGPAPFLPLDPSLPLAILGLAFLGLGMAAVFVAAFSDAIATAIDNGFADDIVTYALVSGMWSSAFSFGDFIGPSVGGLLMDWVGFRLGTYFIVAVQIIIFTSLCLLMARDRMSFRKTRLAENYSLVSGASSSYGALEKNNVDFLDPTVGSWLRPDNGK